MAKHYGQINNVRIITETRAELGENYFSIQKGQPKSWGDAKLWPDDILSTSWIIVGNLAVLIIHELAQNYYSVHELYTNTNTALVLSFHWIMKVLIRWQM